jgi:hypothetical protein
MEAQARGLGKRFDRLEFPAMHHHIRCACIRHLPTGRMVPPQAPGRHEEDTMFRFTSAATAGWIAALALVLAVPPPKADAQVARMLVPCAARQAVVELLEQQHGEQRRGLGLTFAGHILEIFVAGNGHWSALLSSADGTSCMIAAGEGWHDEAPVAGEQS